MLSTQLAMERLEGWNVFLKVLSNVWFLPRQGLTFSGDANESDSNFLQLIWLCLEDNSKLAEWIQQKTDKFKSGEMQNEIIIVMALCILRWITEELQNSWVFCCNGWWNNSCFQCWASFNVSQVGELKLWNSRRFWWSVWSKIHRCWKHLCRNYWCIPTPKSSNLIDT